MTATTPAEQLSTSNLRFDFTGRTVIVTGAAKGIGRSLAEAFAAAHADVVLVGRTSDGLEQAASEVGGTAVVADFSDGFGRCLGINQWFWPLACH